MTQRTAAAGLCYAVVYLDDDDYPTDHVLSRHRSQDAAHRAWLKVGSARNLAVCRWRYTCGDHGVWEEI